MAADQKIVPFWLHLVGNHELYNFTREQLICGIEMDGLKYSCAAPPQFTNQKTAADIPAVEHSPENNQPRVSHLYYSFLIRPGSPWRVVVLDPYDVSLPSISSFPIATEPISTWQVSCIRSGGGRHGFELTIANGGMDAEAAAKCQVRRGGARVRTFYIILYVYIV
jgi:hypothetical protein